MIGKILAKAAPDEMMSDVMVQGNLMLTKSEHTRTIVNLDAETITNINDREKTFTVMTFDDLRAMMQQGHTGASSEGASEENDEPDAHVKMDFSLDRTGVWETINGYNAERVILTLFGDVEAAEGSDAQAMEGQFVLAMETWMSTEVPGYQEVQDFEQRYAEKMGEALFQNSGDEGLTNALSTIIGNDPRLKASMERAQQEAAGLEGMTVRSTTYIVTVPKDMTYDPEMVFAEEKAEEPKEEKKKGGLGGFASRLAQKATDLAEGASNEASSQRTLVKTTMDYGDFSTSTISSSAFEIDPTYEEVSYKDH